MNICEESENFQQSEKPKRSIFKKIVLFASILLFLALAGVGAILYKTGSTYFKISDSKHPIWDNILALLPIEKDSFAGRMISNESFLQNEPERVNIAILGMRGEDDPNGGMLADTIMIASIMPRENKLALISIPRDLYIKVPHSEQMKKINFVYAFGQSHDKNGIKYTEEALEYVSGLNIHYSITVNFEAFKEIIDMLGGITVHVPRALSENTQWQGQPFYVPAGDQKMDGDTALLYARARYSTSDFDRAKRQQEILIAIRNKAVSTGILLNPAKINNLMNIAGDNVKTNLNAWEIKELIKIARNLDLTDARKKVFDSTEEGLLEAKTGDSGEYILVPQGSTFSEIHRVCDEIFN